MAKEMSRRNFLKTGAAAALGLAVVPSTVLGKKFGYTAPSDKLNILGVGIGGRGAADLHEMESQNIIGLCDVDWKYADHVFKRYPAAKKYNDYRRMYDELLKSADAVMVATADHTHAIIAAEAMTAGKHVYVEKPLTHSVYESRLLTKLAAKYRVATQMGNQGASGEGVRKVCEWIWNGEIGEITRVDAFTDRPIWPQGLTRPENDERVPKTMNWEAFIGPAPFRPYNSAYTPWNFRGWWDFGTGALGDMACHSCSMVSATGFSEIMCFPAAMARAICSGRESARAHRATASMAGSSRISRSSATTFAPGTSLRAVARASGERSQMPATSQQSLFSSSSR